MENQNQVVAYPAPTDKAPKNLRRACAVSAVGVGSALMATASNAAIDAAQLTTDISAQTSNVETIGMAILGVLVVIAGIALLRRIIH